MMNDEVKKCLNCGIVIVHNVNSRKLPNQLFCCKSCNRKYHYERNITPYTCPMCGTVRYLHKHKINENSLCMSCAQKGSKYNPLPLDYLPQTGEIRKGAEIGKEAGGNWLWHACEECGKERWVHLIKGGPESKLCYACGHKTHKYVLLANDYQPQEGELRHGIELGIKSRRIYIYARCPVCQRQRWVNQRYYNISGGRCKSCSKRGELAPAWKGGKRQTVQGYIRITVYPGDFFAPMASRHSNITRSLTVFEHRLVMAQHLGRCLQPWEKVHHKNGIKDDNRIENLELTTDGAHITMHHKGYRDGYQKGYSDGSDIKLKELQTEIRLLRWEMKQLRESDLL